MRNTQQGEFGHLEKEKSRPQLSALPFASCVICRLNNLPEPKFHHLQNGLNGTGV